MVIKPTFKALKTLLASNYKFMYPTQSEHLSVSQTETEIHSHPNFSECLIMSIMTSKLKPEVSTPLRLKVTFSTFKTA